MIASPNQNQRRPARLSQIGNMNSVRKNFLLRVDSAMLDSSTLSSNAPTSSDLYKPRGYHDSYNLKKVSSNTSVDSALTVQSKYKVNLQLNSKEITLLRYTWNKMLVEELIEHQELSLPIPGSLSIQPREKTANYNLRLAQLALSMFCTQFYGILLSMAPELEVAFPSLRHQAAAMASVMSLAINSLENLSVLDEYLTKLGKTHTRVLGIEPAQFEMMGEALIQTFNERFGNKFTHELEVLWIKLYMYLANSLLQYGMDPTLKLSTDVKLRAGIYTENVDRVDSDTNSISSSLRSDPRSDWRSAQDTLRQDSLRSNAGDPPSSISGRSESKPKTQTPKAATFNTTPPTTAPPAPPQANSVLSSSKAKKTKKKRECVIV